MAKLLVFVLALATLGYLAYYAVTRNRPTGEIEAPTDRLTNVREAAHRIEVDQQEYLDEVEKKTQE